MQKQRKGDVNHLDSVDDSEVAGMLIRCAAGQETSFLITITCIKRETLKETCFLLPLCLPFASCTHFSY